MYDPTLGRFLQPDPIGVDADVNLYRYVLNAPTAYVDPYGENPALAAIGIIFIIEAILNMDFDYCDNSCSNYDVICTIPPPSTWEIGIPFPWLIGIEVYGSYVDIPFVGEFALPVVINFIGDPVYQQLPSIPWMDTKTGLR